MRAWTIAFAIILAGLVSAQAANTPCSGKKGGVSHCRGQKFVCNDGSVSASKQKCSSGGSGGSMWDGPPVDDTPPPAKPAPNR